MAPRKGGKSSQRGKLRRQPTQFGELETTPTSRHLQSSRRVQPHSTLALPNQDDNSPGASNAGQIKPRPSADEFEDEVDDVDLIELDAAGEAVPSAQPGQDFAWSDSAFSTRRSTPVQDDEGQALFEDQESIPDAFSSQKSGPGKLPNTQPLPSQPLPGFPANPANQEVTAVDFSETASTARRSSPYFSQAAASQAAVEERWEFEFEEHNPLSLLPSTIPDSLQFPEMAPFPQGEPMKHLPEDELYDATPPRSSADDGPVAPLPKNPEVTSDVSKQPQHEEGPNVKRTSDTKRGPKKSSKASKDSLSRFLRDEVGSVGDAEVPPSSSREKNTAKRRKPDKRVHVLQDASEDAHDSPSTENPEVTESGAKVKRRRQRAKPALQFDDATQQIKEVQQRKTVNEPAHMPIVSNLKRSHAAAVSPVASAKKVTPKPKRRVAPKPVQQATRKSTLRSALPQENLDTAAEEENHTPPIALEVEVAANPSPLVDKGTAATAMKKEKVSELEAPASQKSIKAKNETQGSTEDPIVVSSDPDSSWLSEDDGPLPIEISRPTKITHPAQRELLVDPNIRPAEPSDPVQFEEEQPVQVQPQNPVASRPSRRPREQANIKDKAISVAADPKKPVGAPAEKVRHQPVRIGPREVLSARDANILSRRNARQAEAPKRTASAIAPEIDTQPPRKMSKVSRRFSVSQAGSPVPVETAQTRLVDEPSPRGSSYLEGSDLQQEYLSSLAAAESNPDKTRVALKAKPQKQEKAKEVHPESDLNASAQDLHAQILASLQGHDEASTEVQNGVEHDKTHPNKETNRQTRPGGPSEEMGDKLHGLVETMLGHLRTKEATAYRGADAYRKNGINCVDKIERKYVQEREALVNTFAKRGDASTGGDDSKTSPVIPTSDHKLTGTPWAIDEVHLASYEDK
ncbi:hypothetical protein FSARC_13044 [Fusarium sarcochroum]|uniref:Uncharacterized protein n=1 Tax=Fusarium sarcochroum TaxID=1208366 RepID=A0A8H4T475_9HYPO|nr:hypothetical protein FSARC_13044 [Fusarium sarcochroum]